MESVENIKPCPWCKKMVRNHESLRHHVRLKHKKLRCTNCGKSLTRCEDFNAVGQAFACETKRRNR